MKTLIVDYGLCNLDSVRRATEECGGTPFVSNDPNTIKNADSIILPGVGNYSDAMQKIQSSGWYDAIRNEVAKYEIPILGICLGMQLLSTSDKAAGMIEQSCRNGSPILSAIFHMVDNSLWFRVMTMVFKRNRTFALRNRSIPSRQVEKEPFFRVILSKVSGTAPYKVISTILGGYLVNAAVISSVIKLPLQYTETNSPMQTAC